MRTASGRRPIRRRSPSLVGRPRARQDWDGLSAREVLERHPPQKIAPFEVVEVLISLFNHRHTAKEKGVSFKTQAERAAFLRRFFRDLQGNTVFKTLPDPRNLADRHIRAMVRVWDAQRLGPATIQTYLSFLRGFSKWIKKPGLVRRPAAYGLSRERYERHEAGTQDKSWSAAGFEIDELIAKICAFDLNIGAVLILIRAFGMRKKEALMLCPHRSVVPFEATGFPVAQKKADSYLRIMAGSKGGRGRFVPIDSEARLAAIQYAKRVVADLDGHVGPPTGLKQSMRRYHYVLEKFGVTKKALGVTGHGLRHEVLNDHYERRTGAKSPVRGGGAVAPELDTQARLEVADLAGHARKRASNAYCGAVARAGAGLAAKEEAPASPNVAPAAGGGGRL